MVPNILKEPLAQQTSTLNQLQESVSNINIATKSISKMASSSNKLHRSASWQELSPEPDFNIGVIIDSTRIKDAHVSAINKPASRCQLVSVVVLHPSTDEANSTSSLKDSVKKWLKSNKVSANVEHLDFIGTEQSGCDEMLRSSSIHAVYVIVPPSSQKEYVIEALNAKKHVLANDPTSVILSDFMEELECAKKNGKFIQTTCMFVHQYRVQRFLNHVLQDDNFGRITEVDASIQLNCDDVEKVGVKLPFRKEDGCIRVLGRFCVLVSTMFFNRVGSYAESAKVNSCRCGSNGEIVSADCTVNFTNDRKLNFFVAYIQSATRQAIELKATSRYATMNDFVIEHPDGLATYRVYDKEARCQGNMNALHCDSIDVAMGMGQERGLWRSFVRLGEQIDRNEGWEDNEMIAECKELTDVALQMKKILIALMESLENGGKEVAVEGIGERSCPP
jgi:predicted dehydrogenase